MPHFLQINFAIFPPVEGRPAHLRGSNFPSLRPCERVPCNNCLLVYTIIDLLQYSIVYGNVLY